MNQEDQVQNAHEESVMIHVSGPDKRPINAYPQNMSGSVSGASSAGSAGLASDENTSN